MSWNSQGSDCSCALQHGMFCNQPRDNTVHAVHGPSHVTSFVAQHVTTHAACLNANYPADVVTDHAATVLPSMSGIVLPNVLLNLLVMTRLLNTVLTTLPIIAVVHVAHPSCRSCS